MSFLRKYATGTGADIYIPIVKRAVVDFAVGADWTPAAGDVKISIDGAAAANIGTLPVAVAMGNGAVWKFVFTNAELTGKYIVVTVVDAATKAVEDQSFVIETYGNASALHPFDLGTANVTLAAVIHTGAVIPTVTNLTNLPSIPANWLDAAGIAASALNGKGDWNIGKTGYALTAAEYTALVNLIYDELTSEARTAGSFGQLLKDNLNAAILSRAAPGDLMGLANDAITAAKIAADAIGASELATDAVNEIRDAVWAKVVEAQGSYTAQQVLSVLLAVLAGVTATGGSVLKTPDGLATRVTATLDASDNRTAITLAPSA